MVMESCPDFELQPVLAAANGDPAEGIAQLNSLLSRYPDDARLHFLRGSLLAAAQRYDEAILALARAVSLDPEYVLARFQLGFLQLTCGRADEAQQIWLPLLGLADDNPFRHFAVGMGRLIRDEFAPAIEALETGMALNQTQPVVNNDVQLIVDEIRRLMTSGPQKAGQEGATSETQLLFERYAVHDTSAYRH